MRHPLLDVLLDAAADRFPPVDGGVTVLPPATAEGATLEAVVAFTGHAFILTERSLPQLGAWGADGFGGAHHPRVLTGLAGATGQIGVIDTLLVGRGTGVGMAIPPAVGLDEHHRVRHALAIRSDVAVYADARGLVTISRGLAGRPEISVEANAESQGRGGGRGLVGDGLGAFPEGSPVFAAVSPGNARSLRMFLALGFVPLGSEVIIRHPWPSASR